LKIGNKPRKTINSRKINPIQKPKRILTSRRDTKSKSKSKDKYKLREQFKNWRNIKNKSYLFSSTFEDKFYNQNTKGNFIFFI